MRRVISSILIALGLGLVASVSPAHAAPDYLPAQGLTQGRWVGTSTNPEGTFNYGAVSFTLRGKMIIDFKIEGVTVSGCGGYKSIIVPRMRINGTRVTATYVPIPGLDDVVKVNARFAGGMLRGTFSEGPLCSGAGKFVARPA